MERCSVVKAEHEGVVRLMVVVLIDSHNGVWLCAIVYTAVLVIITHKYYGIIIYSMVLVGAEATVSYGRSDGAVNRLAVERTGSAVADCRNRISCAHSSVINHIKVLIGQICGFGPVGLNGYGCNTLRNIPVGTLVKYPAAGGV